MYDITKTMKEIEKMRNGGVGKLSTAELIPQFVSISAAKKALPAEQYAEIYELYSAFAENTDKIELTYDEYYEAGLDILAGFDMIAPAENYCTDEALLAELREYEADMEDEAQMQIDDYVEQFTDFFDLYGVDYEVEDDRVIYYSVNLESRLENASCVIYFKEDFMKVYTRINYLADPDKKLELLEFFAKENIKDEIGNFQVDLQSGEVFYAVSSFLFEEEEIPLFYIPVFTQLGADRFSSVGDEIFDMVVPEVDD